MARGDAWTRVAIRSAGAACALTVLVGCPPRASTPETAPPVDAVVTERAAELARARETLAPFVAAHNARVALLETFEAPAATVLRYPDRDRVQEDQLDGFIYLSTNGRGAFELRLLGKTWAWLGGDGTRSWIYFSPPNEPSVLHVYERLVDGTRTDATQVVGTAELTLLTPGSLRFLLGLAPIAPDWSVTDCAAQPGDANGAIHDRFAVRWSPTPATVATANFGVDGLPRRVSVSDLDGNEIARATLSEYERVQRPELAIGAWPRTATRVVIEAPRSKASARLAIDRDALGRRAPRARDEFFDLGELQLYLAPTEVIYHDANGAARPDAAKAPSSPAASPSPAPAPQKGT